MFDEDLDGSRGAIKQDESSRYIALIALINRNKQQKQLFVTPHHDDDDHSSRQVWLRHSVLYYFALDGFLLDGRSSDESAREVQCPVSKPLCHAWYADDFHCAPHVHSLYL